MSRKNMLGASVRETKGVITDLHEKLGGPHGKEWLAATKRFLRKENPLGIIDCSVQPMVPDGWRIDTKDQIASRFQGELIWSPKKIRLHFDPGQTGKGEVKGENLKVKLKGQPVLPANVVDCLLNHPALIPPEWNRKFVFFWGTIYRDSDGRAFVWCLRRIDPDWYCDVRWLGANWSSFCPAAVLAG